MDAPFRGILSAYFVACGARDPRTHGVQGLFVWGGGLLRAPSQALFTLHVFPAPGFFLFSSLAVGANACRGELAGRLHFVWHSSHVELRNGLPELIVLFRRETAMLQYASRMEGRIPRAAPRLSRNVRGEDETPSPNPFRASFFYWR